MPIQHKKIPENFLFNVQRVTVARRNGGKRNPVRRQQTELYLLLYQASRSIIKPKKYDNNKQQKQINCNSLSPFPDHDIPQTNPRRRQTKRWGTVFHRPGLLPSSHPPVVVERFPAIEARGWTNQDGDRGSCRGCGSDFGRWIESVFLPPHTHTHTLINAFLRS